MLPVFAQVSPTRGPLAALLLASIVALAAAAPDAAPSPTPLEDVRALWVTRTTLGSPEAVTKMIAAARDGGFNTLLVQVRGRGDAYYRSTLEPRAPELAAHPDFDPLGATIAQAHAELQAADLMRLKAAWLFDQGEPCGAEANMAKLLASEASWKAANACMNTFGGFAFAHEYDIERKFRETRLYSIAPISNNLVLAHIGKHVLGMPRFY